MEESEALRQTKIICALSEKIATLSYELAEARLQVRFLQEQVGGR